MSALRLAGRFLRETDKRLLWKLAWTMGVKGVLSVERHKRRLRRGQFFPPFLYVSVINSCNLRCQGCWVDVAAKQQAMSPDAFHKLVREAREAGNVFFGIVGGEPFMHPDLVEMLARHPDCYFQVFTNGHFLTDDKARRLRELGNVTPLVSVEGTELVSDQRRGRSGVYGKSLEGVHNALKHRLFTGVCTSVCQTNIDDMVQEAWIDRLIEMGVMYTWFHVYRPVGPDPRPELCLTPEQQLRLRRFVVDMRVKKPIIIVDAYYDGDGQALCPAVNGLSNHINPWGDIEPCPIIQFSRESIHANGDDRPLKEKFIESAFLRDVRDAARSVTRGCIVLERPDLLKAVVDKHGAKDSTARGTALAELEVMHGRPSQFDPAHQVPERSWAYRLAKRFWFSDFGMYRGQDHTQVAASPASAAPAGR